jgi:hypothetical protein
VQELGAKKVLIFYSLDHPTNVTPNFNIKKHLTFNLLFLKKEHHKKHVIDE